MKQNPFKVVFNSVITDLTYYNSLRKLRLITWGLQGAHHTRTHIIYIEDGLLSDWVDDMVNDFTFDLLVYYHIGDL